MYAIQNLSLKFIYLKKQILKIVVIIMEFEFLKIKVNEK